MVTRERERGELEEDMVKELQTDKGEGDSQQSQFISAAVCRSWRVRTSGLWEV